MSKCYFFSLLLLLGSLGCFAQISLTNTNIPDKDTYGKLYVVTKGFDNLDLDAAKAENNEWDVSGVTKSAGSFSVQYVEASQTQYGPRFKNANLAYTTNGSASSYYNITSNNYTRVGNTGSVFINNTNFLYPEKYDKPLSMRKFPVSYLDSFNSSTNLNVMRSYEYNGDSIHDTILGKIEFSYKVSGYGKMTLPSNKTVEVLRMLVTETRTDTVHSPIFGTRPGVFTQQWLEFRAAEYAMPVVKAGIVNGNISYLYVLDPAESTEIGTGEGFEETYANILAIYPNPAQDIIQLGTAQAGMVKIYNTNGQLVQQQLTRNGIITVSSLKEGIYFLNFEDSKSGALYTARFIKN